MTYIFSNGTLSDALEVNDNFNKLNKLTNEKAINDVSATNSGVLAGSSQVLIDKFLDSNGQNNTVDTGAGTTAAYISTNKYFDCKLDGTLDTTTNPHSMSSTSSDMNEKGFKFYTNTACILISVTKSASSSATVCKLKDNAGTLIQSASYSGNTAYFTPYQLSTGTNYRVENSGYTGSTTIYYTASGSRYPINDTNINLTAFSIDGNDGASNTVVYEITSLITNNNSSIVYLDSTIQSVATTIPTGMTKVFVTPLMYEALSTGDSITADVSIDNGAHYTTGVPINTWTPITSANGTQLIVKMNLNTASGVSSPKILGWRVLME